MRLMFDFRRSACGDLGEVYLSVVIELLPIRKKHLTPGVPL